MTVEEKLKELGIDLPDAPQPLGAYVPIVTTGNLVFLSGILPLVGGTLTRRGRVGQELTLDDAREDARRIVLNALAILRAHLGSLDRVARCVQIIGYIASAPDFFDQPKVLNAASDLLYEIFGDPGRHTRVAVGVSSLPLNSPVEIAFIFEISQ